MNKFDFNSKVAVKLNENGKMLYYLDVMDNTLADDKLNSNGYLVGTLEEIMIFLGTTYPNETKQIDALSSNIIHFVEEEKCMSLTDEVIIYLSDFGKQLYYLDIKDSIDEQNLSNKLSENNYLVISMSELIRIFGRDLDALPFQTEEILIDEKYLKDSKELDIDTRNR